MRLPGVLPRPRLAFLTGGLAGLAALAALEPALAGLALAGLGGVIAAVLVDLRLSASASDLVLARAAASVLSHGASNRVTVGIENRGSRAAHVELEEVWPSSVVPDRHLLRALVPPRGRTELTYHVSPGRRGPLDLAPAAVRVRGPLGLVAHQRAKALPPAALRVYPNLAGVGRYELAARRSALAALGVHAVRALGPGTEIEGLREYSRDDEFRRIDWKATARRGQPVTRDLRDERSQQVLLLLDAGRSGAAALGGAGRGGFTRLDHAVNAALVLAHVAAVRGDRVGLMVFDRQVRRHLPPARASRAVVPLLARALYDAQALPVEPDWDLAFRTLALRDRRRSLLVLFTDLLSPEASDAVAAHMARSRGRHLPLCVAIADPELAVVAAAPIDDAASVYRRAAACELRDERARALRAMRERGVLVVDATPDALTPDLVSRYLQLKARRAL